MTYDNQLTEARRATLWAQIDERNLEQSMVRKPAAETPWDALGVPVRRFGTGWDMLWTALVWATVCVSFFFAGAVFGMVYAAWRFTN